MDKRPYLERVSCCVVAGELVVADLLPRDHDVPCCVSVVLQRRRVSRWTRYHRYRTASLRRPCRLEQQAIRLS